MVDYNRSDQRSGFAVGAWINVFLGLAIAAIPFLFGTLEEGAFWNHIVAGLLVLVLAGYNAWAAANRIAVPVWAAGINVLIGLWLVVAPFVYEAAGAHLWADVILGVAVAAIAAYNAWAASSTPETRIRGRRAL